MLRMFPSNVKKLINAVLFVGGAAALILLFKFIFM